jgi:hypothetical protein
VRRCNLSDADFLHWEPGNPRTLLSVAAQMGSTAIVRLILTRAPNTPVDGVDVTRATALHAAAQWHHVDTIRLLAAEHGGGTTCCKINSIKF